MSDTTHYTSTQATVAALAAAAAGRFGERVAARHKVDGEWRELTYEQVGAAIEEVALGLIELGIESGDRVAILSDTRLEWTLASYGITAAGAVVVPVYPTNSPRECEWVLGNSGARAVFCESAQQRAKIDQVAGELPDLAHTIGIEAGGGELMLDELRERGGAGQRAELRARQAALAPEDPDTIIYTPGTTGPPKGVVLSHRNAISVCEMVQELQFVAADERTYLYLPLAHAFALTAQLASYDLGSMIIYYGRDTKRIVEELIETRPTYLPSVPRIFEKLYTAAIKLRDQSGEIDRESFEQAIKLGVEVRRRRRDGLHAGQAQVRHGRACHAGRRDQDRRRRSGDPDPRAQRVQRVLAQPGGDRADVGGRLAADRRRRRARRRRLSHDHRAQEGHHHHRRRQEPDPGEHRERPQAVALHLACRDVRRPEAVSGRADHARSRGDRALGAGERAQRGPRRTGVRRRGTRPGPARARSRQFQLRAGGTNQAVRDPRPRPVARAGRADADAEGQAKRDQRPLRGAVRVA